MKNLTGAWFWKFNMILIDMDCNHDEQIKAFHFRWIMDINEKKRVACDYFDIVITNDLIF